MKKLLALLAFATGCMGVVAAEPMYVNCYAQLAPHPSCTSDYVWVPGYWSRDWYGNKVWNPGYYRRRIERPGW